MMTTKGEEESVRETNQAFYRAFRERDFTRMERLWAKRAVISCAHPGQDVIVGRDAVMESLKGILSHPDAPSLACDRVEVRLFGDLAVATCVEGTPGEVPALLATNVFVREDGAYRFVHHHAGPLAGSVRLPAIAVEQPRTLM